MKSVRHKKVRASFSFIKLWVTSPSETNQLNKNNRMWAKGSAISQKQGPMMVRPASLKWRKLEQHAAGDHNISEGEWKHPHSRKDVHGVKHVQDEKFTSQNHITTHFLQHSAAPMFRHPCWAVRTLLVDGWVSQFSASVSGSEPAGFQGDTQPCVRRDAAATGGNVSFTWKDLSLIYLWLSVFWRRSSLWKSSF